MAIAITIVITIVITITTTITITMEIPTIILDMYPIIIYKCSILTMLSVKVI